MKKRKLRKKKNKERKIILGKKSTDRSLPFNATALEQPNIHYSVFLFNDLRNIFEAI